MTSGPEAPISEKHIEEAMDLLGKWFPKEKSSIDQHREEIKNSLLTGTPVPASSPMRKVTYSAKIEDQTADGVPGIPVPSGIIADPCHMSCLVALLRSVQFILSISGLAKMWEGNQALEQADLDEIERLIPRDPTGGLSWNFFDPYRELFLALNEAATVQDKAAVMARIFGETWNATGIFRGFFTYCMKTLSWTDWVLYCSASLAQIIAWHASGGAAFVAKVVLTLMSAKTLLDASLRVRDTCMTPIAPAPSQA